MAEFKKVKTAVVGCGMISTIYVKNLVNLFSIIDLVALCDMREEMARERAAQFNVPNVMTLDEICADKEIELVVNLTGPAAHYDVIKTLLLAGKHVYTEKMLCLDFNQGKELVALANEKNLYLGCAPDTFMGAGLQTARNLLDAGIIGTPTSCVACINRNQPLNSEFFGYIRFAGGSFPYDVGIYYVVAMLSLMGPVKKVAGFAKEAPTHEGRLVFAGNYGQSWNMVGSNLQTAAVQFENGVLGNIHLDGLSIDVEQPHFAIYGTKGIMYLGDCNRFDTSVSIVFPSGEKVNFPHTHGYDGTVLYGEPTPFDWGGHRGIGVAEMAWSIREGRKNRASKEFGLHALELILGIDEACAEDKVYMMETTFEKPAALPSGLYSTEMGGFARADAETSLIK